MRIIVVGSAALALLVAGCKGKQKPPGPPAATQQIQGLPAAPEQPLGALVPEGMDLVVATRDLPEVQRKVSADAALRALTETPLWEDLKLSSFTRLPFVADARVRTYTSSAVVPISYDEALSGPALLAARLSADDKGKDDARRTHQWLLVKAIDGKVESAARLAMAWQSLAPGAEVEVAEVGAHRIVQLKMGRKRLHYVVLRNRFLAASHRELLDRALARLAGQGAADSLAVDAASELLAVRVRPRALLPADLARLLGPLDRVDLSVDPGLARLGIRLGYDGAPEGALPKGALGVVPRDALLVVAGASLAQRGVIEPLVAALTDARLQKPARALLAVLGGSATYAFFGMERKGRYPTAAHLLALAVTDEGKARVAAGELWARAFGRKAELREGLACIKAKGGYEPCFAVVGGQLLLSGHPATLQRAVATARGMAPSMLDRPALAGTEGGAAQAALFVDPGALGTAVLADLRTLKAPELVATDVDEALGSALSRLAALRPAGAVLLRKERAAEGALVGLR